MLLLCTSDRDAGETRVSSIVPRAKKSKYTKHAQEVSELTLSVCLSVFLSVSISISLKETKYAQEDNKLTHTHTLTHSLCLSVCLSASYPKT